MTAKTLPPMASTEAVLGPPYQPFLCDPVDECTALVQLVFLPAKNGIEVFQRN
jgi:hypothetical protein